ncbi:MAG: tetratricopeptide repeat protein [archaeon]
MPKLSKNKQTKKENKPEWLIQEEKNKEFFNSNGGLSPINVLREKAKEYQKNKEFQKAEELYKKIAKMSRRGFDYCVLGDIFYKQNKFKESITAYKEAIKLEPIAPYPKNAIEKVKRKQNKK